MTEGKRKHRTSVPKHDPRRGGAGNKPRRPAAGEPSASGATGAVSDGALRFAREVTPLTPLCDIADMPLPELLLPAGSALSLEAAIEAGADAVYFGARSFSARARAENFDESEIAAALRLCRAHGVRAYAAVNTRVRDSELGEAMRLVRLLVDEGVDALITADLGLCALIRREFGAGVELHASTQLTAVSSYDARALAELGFARVVAPRELTLEALSELCEKGGVEIEAFVHGAHCVSLSGQCLMSSLIGGRSANRGECAQPCRMEYSCAKARGALLSLSDMCYAPDIPAKISTGVRSLKVEGRQKDASYVYGVGRIYRRLLDERRGATPDEIAALAELFERGFTDGYLRGSFADMRGVRREDAVRGSDFSAMTKRVDVSAELTLRANECPALKMSTDDGRLSAAVALDTPLEVATGAALTEERAKRQLERLGNTPFRLSGFVFNTDGAAWLSAADLNELRRRATEALTAPCARGTIVPVSDEETSETPAIFSRLEDISFGDEDSVASSAEATRPLAQFVGAEQIPDEAWEKFGAIYLPHTELTAAARGRGARLSLPPFMTDADAIRIADMISPGDHVLVHSVGQIYLVRSLGAIPDASFRLNIWNSECARVLRALCGDGALTVSPELSGAAMRDISRSVGGANAVVYGKLPIMYTVRCMIRGESCRGGSGGKTGRLRDSAPCRAYLTDRTGARFFALGTRECTNELFNSVPTWTADRPLSGVSGYYIFSDEDAAEVVRILDDYDRGALPRGNVRRVK